MSRPNVRRAQIQEAPGIAQFVNQAYRGESSKKGWTTEADLLGGQRTDSQAIQEQIRQPENQILILEVEAELRGCVFLRDQRPTLYLGMLTVHPEFQNKGYGKILMQKAHDWALENQFSSVEMTVISQRESLINYYQRQGYQLTGERRPFPSQDPRFGIPKVPNLEFVVLEKKLL